MPLDESLLTGLYESLMIVDIASCQMVKGIRFSSFHVFEPLPIDKTEKRAVFCAEEPARV